MTTACFSATPTATQEAPEVRAARFHFKVRISERLKHPPYEVTSPIIRLALYCQQHGIELEDIAPDLTYTLLLQHLLEGYELRFAEIELDHLKRMIMKLRSILLEPSFRLTNCETFLKTLLLIHEGKNREFCQHSIENWRAKFTRGETII